MTEDEVKTKWCPMTRLEGDYPDEVGANRTKSGRILDATLCIASDCMMWRWDIEEPHEGVYCQSATNGYCGLAGKP